MAKILLNDEQKKSFLDKLKSPTREEIRKIIETNGKPIKLPLAVNFNK